LKICKRETGDTVVNGVKLKLKVKSHVVCRNCFEFCYGISDTAMRNMVDKLETIDEIESLDEYLERENEIVTEKIEIQNYLDTFYKNDIYSEPCPGNEFVQVVVDCDTKEDFYQSRS